MTAPPDNPMRWRIARPKPALQDEVDGLIVEMVEAYLSKGPGFRGPFEDFCEIIEPLVHDALGSARRDGAQIANEAAEADLATAKARIAEVEGERDEAQLLLRTYLNTPVGKLVATAEASTREATEREARVVAVLEDAVRPSAIKLMAGEMTAQEARTAYAVAKGIAAKVRSALQQDASVGHVGL